VIGDVKVVPGGGITGETLPSIPRHILDHDDGTVGEEVVIEETVDDDGFLIFLHDSGNDTETGKVGVVSVEDAVGAFFPVTRGSVDGFLYIFPVEVDFGAGGDIREATWESEDIPENGASGCDLVGVPERVLVRWGGSFGGFHTYQQGLTN
jgi:hypothetical protein